VVELKNAGEIGHLLFVERQGCWVKRLWKEGHDVGKNDIGNVEGREGKKKEKVPSAILPGGLTKGKVMAPH